MVPLTDDGIAAVTMPKWGLSMQLGKITAWAVAEGDEVQVGDDLMTDRGRDDAEVGLVDAARQDHRVGVAEGDEVQVGDDLADIETEKITAAGGRRRRDGAPHRRPGR